MRGWWLALGLLVALNWGAVLYWHRDEGITHPENFENHDTRTILENLQKPHTAWQWFIGDWVLGNSFYRPLPSLLYELDYALWGTYLLAYKWTNGVLATLCALGVVWFVYELTRQRVWALGTGFIFTLWQTGLLSTLPAWITWGAFLGGIVWGVYRGDWKWGLGAGSLLFVGLSELTFVPNLWDLHQASFSYRAIGWIPGRTTTLMTLFALVALGSYCRYCWTGQVRWAFLSLGGVLGALGSHESAIALPFLLALCGVAVSWQGGRFYWWVPALGGVLLVLYAGFYQQVVPGFSEYHQQRLKRFKTIPGTVLYWLLPPLPEGWLQIQMFLSAPLSIFLPLFWKPVGTLVIYGAGLWVFMRKEAHPSRLALVGLLGSVVAYAPLLPVLPLMHYYYLPAVLRAFWVCLLLWRGILELCQPTLRPTKRAISVAMVDAMSLKRSSPPSRS